MKEWQVREKHENDFHESARLHGRMNNRFITLWRGKEIMAEMEKRGHDRIRLDKCKCYKEMRP